MLTSPAGPTPPRVWVRPVGVGLLCENLPRRAGAAADPAAPFRVAQRQRSTRGAPRGGTARAGDVSVLTSLARPTPPRVWVRAVGVLCENLRRRAGAAADPGWAFQGCPTPAIDARRARSNEGAKPNLRRAT